VFQAPGKRIAVTQLHLGSFCKRCPA